MKKTITLIAFTIIVWAQSIQGQTNIYRSGDNTNQFNSGANLNVAPHDDNVSINAGGGRVEKVADPNNPSDAVNLETLLYFLLNPPPQGDTVVDCWKDRGHYCFQTFIDGRHWSFIISNESCPEPTQQGVGGTNQIDRATGKKVPRSLDSYGLSEENKAAIRRGKSPQGVISTD